MDASGNINTDGGHPLHPPSVSLSEIWNLIGYLGTDNAVAATALSAIPNKWSIVWTWNNGEWFGKHATIPNLPLPIQSSYDFNQGKAYWIRVKKDRQGTGHSNRVDDIDLARQSIRKGRQARGEGHSWSLPQGDEVFYMMSPEN